MSCFSWIVFGALAGWLASIVVGNNRQQGCISNVIVGIVGAFLGGGLMSAINGEGMSMESFGWEWTSFLTAVCGSIALLILVNFSRRN